MPNGTEAPGLPRIASNRRRDEQRPASDLVAQQASDDGDDEEPERVAVAVVPALVRVGLRERVDRAPWETQLVCCSRWSQWQELTEDDTEAGVDRAVD